MGSLLNYIIRRILCAIPVFLAVSIITFLVTNAAGDPVQIVRFGIRNLNPAQLKAIQDYFHVNEPLYTRYFLWLSDLIRGNLGQSLYSGSVAGKVVPWIGSTLELQIPALLLALAIGIPIGTYSAKRQYSKSDIAVTTTAIFGISIAVVVTAMSDLERSEEHKSELQSHHDVICRLLLEKTKSDIAITTQ